MLNNNAYYAEYIWIDGTQPTRHIRSKTRILRPNTSPVTPNDFPEWSFDGSSTNQASGDKSDCILKPVCVVPDPTRPSYEYLDGGTSVEIPSGYLVLCEVLNAVGTPHESNTRAPLRELLKSGGGDELGIWIAFEQEYTLFKGSRPLGFPETNRFPPAQGPYYCGVGCDEVYGREMVEAHLHACIDANIYCTGINAEVMPGQWEFQIGGPEGGPLLVSDHLWLARWLLYRLGEDHDIYATLDQKPVPGDWNGAGLHTNFSTERTREMPHDGLWVDYSHIFAGRQAIDLLCMTIGSRIEEHTSVYGEGLELRLTGKHETAPVDKFSYGVSDRTASIRIPLQVARDGGGYLEDRRPGANADPYEVSRVMTESAIIAQNLTHDVARQMLEYVNPE